MKWKESEKDEELHKWKAKWPRGNYKPQAIRSSTGYKFLSDTEWITARSACVVKSDIGEVAKLNKSNVDLLKFTYILVKYSKKAMKFYSGHKHKTYLPFQIMKWTGQKRETQIQGES
jgi:hypothetical protein